MKAWLKGGLWGLGIWALLSFILNFLWSVFFRNPLIESNIFINITPILFEIFPISNEGVSWLIFIFGTFIITPIIYFGIGALIGFIIGKIRSKK